MTATSGCLRVYVCPTTPARCPSGTSSESSATFGCAVFGSSSDDPRDWCVRSRFLSQIEIEKGRSAIGMANRQTQADLTTPPKQKSQPVRSTMGQQTLRSMGVIAILRQPREAISVLVPRGPSRRRRFSSSLCPTSHLDARRPQRTYRFQVLR